MNYFKLDESSSMYNTPPTFSWYVAGKVFKWLKGKGGVKAIGQVNEKKAIQLCVSAGTIIIFSSLTPHSSGANITKKNRKAYLSQYSSENIIDPFNGIQRGRAYLI